MIATLMDLDSSDDERLFGDIGKDGSTSNAVRIQNEEQLDVLADFMSDPDAQYAEYDELIQNLPKQHVRSILIWLGITDVNSSQQWARAFLQWHRAWLSSAVIIACLSSVSSTFDWTSESFQRLLLQTLTEDSLTGSNSFYQPPVSVKSSFWNVYVEHLTMHTGLPAHQVAIPEIQRLSNDTSQLEESQPHLISPPTEEFAVKFNSRALEIRQICAERTARGLPTIPNNRGKSSELCATFRCFELEPPTSSDQTRNAVMLAVNERQASTTVGLVMWAAGQVLADFVRLHPSVFAGKRVHFVNRIQKIIP